MFQVIYAPEWMNDAHEYEMQVQLGKNNTRGVTDCYHENIIKLLYNIYIKVLALYYSILRANYMDRVASESLLELIYCKTSKHSRRNNAN